MNEFRAPRWLPGGHAQTIWPVLFSRRFDGAPPAFRRERWSTPDRDFIDVDWLDDGAPASSLRDGAGSSHQLDDSASSSSRHDGDAPSSLPTVLEGDPPPSSSILLEDDALSPTLLVCFHGLEGSSRSHYAQAFAAEAARRRWRFAVPHFRGCSGELNLAPRAYHSGDHEEIAWVLERFAATHDGPIVAVGVSLGGNALLRYAQEAGVAVAARLRAIAAVSAPLDLAAGARAIGRGFSRQVYTRMFMRTMKTKAMLKLAQHPGLFDPARMRGARDLREFDDVFTGPLHGFAGADDYYARASAGPHLAAIRIPTLVLNARNDPFLPVAALPPQASVGPFVTLWQPAHGGHVGFAGGVWPGHLRTLPDAVASWLAAQP